MRHYLIIFAAFLLLAFASCSNRDKAFQQYLATADSTSFSSDITDPHSPSRKILYTATLSYRVRDVLKAAARTEQLTNSFGGIVVKSELNNESISAKDITYKSDSVKHIQIYTPEANLLVKVPVEKIDSFVCALSTYAQFVIHRKIERQDMTYIYLSNALKNQNDEGNGKQVHYTAPVMDAKELLAQSNKKKQVAEQVIDRRIQNLQMLDDADYATLSINLTQATLVDVSVTVDPGYVMRPSLGTELTAAFAGGVSLFRNILVLLITLWPVWLIAILLWLIYKRRHKFIAIKK